MSSPVLTYSPSDVTMVLCGYRLGGLMSIEMEWKSKPFTTIRGIRGHHTRVYNSDLYAVVRIEVLQTSVSNDALFELVQQDRRNKSARLTMSIKDTGGSTVIDTDNCYISGYPSMRYSEGLNNPVWEIEVLTWTDGRLGGNQRGSFDLMSSVQGAISFLR